MAVKSVLLCWNNLLISFSCLSQHVYTAQALSLDRTGTTDLEYCGPSLTPRTIQGDIEVLTCNSCKSLNTRMEKQDPVNF